MVSGCKFGSQLVWLRPRPGTLVLSMLAVMNTLIQDYRILPAHDLGIPGLATVWGQVQQSCDNLLHPRAQLPMSSLRIPS